MHQDLAHLCFLLQKAAAPTWASLPSSIIHMSSHVPSTNCQQSFPVPDLPSLNCAVCPLSPRPAPVHHHHREHLLSMPARGQSLPIMVPTSLIFSQLLSRTILGRIVRVHVHPSTGILHAPYWIRNAKYCNEFSNVSCQSLLSLLVSIFYTVYPCITQATISPPL